MTWIHTYSGKAVDLLDPQPDQICLVDIAHSLSQLCRFTGHTNRFYSVAEHSSLVCDALAEDHGPAYAWAGLMHDAHEAYCGDVASPIKAVLGETWRTFEGRIEAVVREKYQVPTLDVVKHYDLRALHTEREALLPWPPPRDWKLPPAKPLRGDIRCLSGNIVYKLFLQRALRYGPTRDIRLEAAVAYL